MVTLVNIMVMNGWLTSFSFHVNRPSHFLDKAISDSDLEIWTPMSSSRVWSEGKVIHFGTTLKQWNRRHNRTKRTLMYHQNIDCFSNNCLQNPQCQQGMTSLLEEYNWYHLKYQTFVHICLYDIDALLLFIVAVILKYSDNHLVSCHWQMSSTQNFFFQQYCTPSITASTTGLLTRDDYMTNGLLAQADDMDAHIHSHGYTSCHRI